MTIAAGCANKNLVRLGSGNLKALVVFLVLGISAFATLKGITAPVSFTASAGLDADGRPAIAYLAIVVFAFASAKAPIVSHGTAPASGH